MIQSRITMLVLALIFAGMCDRRLAANQTQNATQPNIIFIFADDWGWGDLGCHGHPYIKTPNIDRLAREGTDFHRFTVASGVCSPSRTAVMTGRFPARFCINGHFAWVPSNAKRNMPDWLDTRVATLPRMLQNAGYRTAHFGKWHLANDMIPDSPLPSEYGYDTYGAFNCAGEQMPVHDDARLASSFIEECHEAGKPFFVNLWIHEPHTPFHTVPKYRWRFRDLNEEDNIYASVLSHADDRIGEVLNTLDRLGITDNSLVIFSSDNGPARNQNANLGLMHDTATGAGFNVAAAKGVTGGRRGYKASLFEGGVGVPFIVRWPKKVAANKVDKTSILSAVDLLPTFCEIANAPLPKGYEADGISQLSAFLGQGNSQRVKPLFWKSISSPNAKPSHWVAYAVVHQQWKFVRNENGSESELFDLINDPLESVDLRDQHKDVAQSLNNMIEAWRKTLPRKPSGNVFSSLRDKPSGAGVQK